MSNKTAFVLTIFVSIAILGIAGTAWFLLHTFGSLSMWLYIGFTGFAGAAQWFAPSIRRWLK